MKLIITIIRDDDAPRLMQALNKEGYSVTKMATTGGFLKAGNMTLLIGTDDEHVDNVIDILRSKCEKRKQIVVSPAPIGSISGAYSSYPVEIDVGGATIFVVDVERFEKI